MTTEEKLIALFFQRSLILKDTFLKSFYINDTEISITWSINMHEGEIRNVRYNEFIIVNNFKELLKWNDFYEKQAERIARRNEGRNVSETQNQFHQAH